MRRRRYLATLATLPAAPGLAGCVGLGGSTDDRDRDPGDTRRPTEPTHGTHRRYTFSGKGDAVHPGLDLSNLVIATASHDGGGHFHVRLRGGGPDQLFVNEVGAHEGTHARRVPGRTYTLSVSAGGEWSVELGEHWARRGEPLPAEATGTGPDVLGPYDFAGEHAIAAEHDGDGRFVAEFLPEIGAKRQLFDAFGILESEATVTFARPAWIAIETTGTWSLAIE